MTDRGMTPAVKAESEKDHARTVHLYSADFDSGTIYLTDAGVNIDWGGNTFLPSKYLDQSPVKETRGLKVSPFTVTLSGVDQSLISIVLMDDFLLRDAKVWRAFLNADLSVISDPVLIVQGRMDAPKIATDPTSGSCTVSIDIVPDYIDYDRRPGRHTNDADQKLYYSTDDGFQYVTNVPTKIYWGRLHPSALPNSPGQITDPNNPGFVPGITDNG